jgi:hypothetical protein
MVLLFVIEALALFALTALLLRYYRSPDVGRWISATVFGGWYLGFFGTVLLPYDLVTDDANGIVIDLWYILFWSTWLLSWVIMPVMMSFWQSGEFSVQNRLAAAVKENVLIYLGMAVLVIIFAVWVGVSQKLTLADLLGFLMALGNTYGLLLIVVLLGSGLVELPRQIWERGDDELRLQQLYMRASQVDESKRDAEFEAREIATEVRATARALSCPFDDTGGGGGGGESGGRVSRRGRSHRLQKAGGGSAEDGLLRLQYCMGVVVRRCEEEERKTKTRLAVGLPETGAAAAAAASSVGASLEAGPLSSAAVSSAAVSSAAVSAPSGAGKKRSRWPWGSRGSRQPAGEHRLLEGHDGDGDGGGGGGGGGGGAADVTERQIVSLHRRLKKAFVSWRRAEVQWQQLVEGVAQVEMRRGGGGYGGRLGGWCLGRCCHRLLGVRVARAARMAAYRAMGLAAAACSLLMLWSESAMGVDVGEAGGAAAYAFAPLAAAYRGLQLSSRACLAAAAAAAASSSGPSPPIPLPPPGNRTGDGASCQHMLRTEASLYLLLPLLFLSVCVYQSLFRLRVFGPYSLQGGRTSDAGSLLMNGMYQCRIQFPLSL